MSLLSVGTALTAMTNALDAAGPVATATGTAAQAASQAIESALTACNAYVASLPASSSTETIIAAQQMIANVQIIAKNFQTGQSPLTITQTGGDLFHIAARYTGDAQNAFAIMAANGLVTPFLPSSVATTFVIPPYQAPVQST
jgi:hypothetical protein